MATSGKIYSGTCGSGTANLQLIFEWSRISYDVNTKRETIYYKVYGDPNTTQQYYYAFQPSWNYLKINGNTMWSVDSLYVDGWRLAWSPVYYRNQGYFKDEWTTPDSPRYMYVKGTMAEGYFDVYCDDDGNASFSYDFSGSWLNSGARAHKDGTITLDKINIHSKINKSIDKGSSWSKSSKVYKTNDYGKTWTQVDLYKTNNYGASGSWTKIY